MTEPEPPASERGRPRNRGGAEFGARVRQGVRWLRVTDRADNTIGVARRFRQVLPGDPDFGTDPLTVTTSAPSTVVRIADKFGGNTGPRATRELGLGALQVWQAGIERIGRSRGTAEVTIVFTDLVGFSRFSLQAGDADTLVLLREVARAVETPIAAHRGRVVKRMGDGLMAAFASPTAAIEALREGRLALAAVAVNGYTPVMRVGIHTGTPTQIGSDLFGVDVTVAARLMQSAGDGGWVISDATLEAIGIDRLAELGLDVAPNREFSADTAEGVPGDVAAFYLDDDAPDPEHMP